MGLHRTSRRHEGKACGLLVCNARRVIILRIRQVAFGSDSIVIIFALLTPLSGGEKKAHQQPAHSNHHRSQNPWIRFLETSWRSLHNCTCTNNECHKFEPTLLRIEIGYCIRRQPAHLNANTCILNNACTCLRKSTKGRGEGEAGGRMRETKAGREGGGDGGTPKGWGRVSPPPPPPPTGKVPLP